MYTPKQRPLQADWAMLFIRAGVGHFLFSTALGRFIPPYLPDALQLVLISGVFEMAGGVAMLLTRFRRPAAWGLSAMLISFLPANIFMGMHPAEAGLPGVPPGIFWARIVLLPFMVWGLVWCTRPRSPDSGGQAL